MIELENQMQKYVSIRKKYEEKANEKCNSNLPYITWCIELGEKDCPQTCYYAIEKLKERRIKKT